MAVPFARACRGRISASLVSTADLRWRCSRCLQMGSYLPGTYTHGIQLAVAPKKSIYVKKKATLASEVFSAKGVPSHCARWKLSRMAIIIIDMASPRDPHIIGLLRPI